ncbi:TetR family transcriptional regulator [Nocardia sp. NBC_00403]|uniref:TetR family transcriptional regulator n=1 Tax=Nocardia sp. NBC_00403 TaxID=2975990 RepID=UPI002E1C2F4B
MTFLDYDIQRIIYSANVIRSAAGVDKSSVIQYFGSKQALFREAVHWDIPIAE